MRRRKGPGRTDYLLCMQLDGMPKSMPTAVLEAKKESDAPLKDMQQAKAYADCDRYEVKYVFSTSAAAMDSKQASSPTPPSVKGARSFHAI